MLAICLRALVVVAAGIFLSSCASRQQQLPEIPQIFEIRAAVVTANAGVPRALLRGIQINMDKAIAATIRPVPLPRAVMAIHVVGMSRFPNEDGVRTETEISVMLSDVVSAHPVHVQSFLIQSFSLTEKTAPVSAAEAIAARLRYAYALNQPPLRNPRDLGPISTRMRGPLDPAATAYPPSVPDTRPIVIPLRNAPLVGADQDPVLNSQTPVAPLDAPAKVPQAGLDPQAKPAPQPPAENPMDQGAKAKVVILPKPQAAVPAQPASGEPCVETLEKKC